MLDIFNAKCHVHQFVRLTATHMGKVATTGRFMAACLAKKPPMQARVSLAMFGEVRYLGAAIGFAGLKTWLKI